jgi:hypothetical protein
MSTSIAIPATIEIKRNRLLALVTAVAVLAAVITGIIVHFAFDSNASAASAQTVATTSASSATVDARRDPPLMSLSPARLAAGALGTGYALPTADQGPTLASVLASMSPETRRYTKAVTSLTFAQLAAGAAGHP